MQHVKPAWLRNVVYSTVAVYIAFFAGYFLLDAVNASQSVVDFWGLTPFVLVLAGIGMFVSIVVYPFIRRLSEWAAFVTALVPFGLMLSAVIETSGNVNIVYRVLFIILVFLLNMVGPYLSIASAVIAWILLIFDFLSLGHPLPQARLINVVADILVTIAAIGGWFFFKRYYMRDKATVHLANLLEQEQFKSNIILESITDGVIVVNTEGVTQIINASAATMFGWSREEAHLLHYNSLYTIMDENSVVQSDSPHGFPANLDAVGLAIKTGQAQHKVIQIQTKNNKRIFVDTLASPIYEETEPTSGGPASKVLVGVITVFRDIDESKREEQQRAEFISTASHEMRTPVAAIEGYLALAMNDKVCLIDEKARTYLQKAHASTQHLGQLFQDLLTSAKADDGRLASHPEVFEFGSYLEKIIEDLKFSAEKKGLQLEYVIGTDQEHVAAASNTTQVVQPLYYVEVDPDRIREVITNLFDNAVKYTPSGKITIGLTGNSDVVQFYIKDTGGGIPPEDLPHLFQKFYRVDNSATRTIGGTGLGLFICRKIVELYHGRIWAKSQLGQGSTFFVNLPRLDAQAADAARLRLANTTQPAAAAPPKTTVVQ